MQDDRYSSRVLIDFINIILKVMDIIFVCEIMAKVDTRQAVFGSTAQSAKELL